MKSNWNDWLTVDKAEGREVLVKFKMVDGSFHIEDALIIRDMETDGIYYSLFDGETFNIKVEPVAWMEIPK